MTNELSADSTLATNCGIDKGLSPTAFALRLSCQLGHVSLALEEQSLVWEGRADRQCRVVPAGLEWAKWEGYSVGSRVGDSSGGERWRPSAKDPAQTQAIVGAMTSHVTGFFFLPPKMIPFKVGFQSWHESCPHV